MAFAASMNIDIIYANSGPAKGRVERANKTLQDRLVKELRLAGRQPWRRATRDRSIMMFPGLASHPFGAVPNSIP
jgi:hypothetical protein